MYKHMLHYNNAYNFNFQKKYCEISLTNERSLFNDIFFADKYKSI
jgi:hypothetical protein